MGGSATASFTNGALSITTAAGQGLAFDDKTAPASLKAGKTFSHFMGLNDLVTSTGISTYDTGLTGGDNHGFTAGEIGAD
jgi:flagellar hook-associated protein 1 FlgK